MTDPWLARIARTSPGPNGKRWGRVRVVDEPMTDYQRYQMASYRESQACGEQVSIARRSDADAVGRDFWLFDVGTPGAFAVLMDYDEEGHWLGAEQTDDPDVLAELGSELDTADKHAVPLNVFLAAADA